MRWCLVKEIGVGSSLRWLRCRLLVPLYNCWVNRFLHNVHAHEILVEIIQASRWALTSLLSQRTALLIALSTGGCKVYCKSETLPDKCFLNILIDSSTDLLLYLHLRLCNDREFWEIEPGEGDHLGEEVC